LTGRSDKCGRGASCEPRKRESVVAGFMTLLMQLPFFKNKVRNHNILFEISWWVATC